MAPAAFSVDAPSLNARALAHRVHVPAWVAQPPAPEHAVRCILRAASQPADLLVVPEHRASVPAGQVDVPASVHVPAGQVALEVPAQAA